MVKERYQSEVDINNLKSKVPQMQSEAKKEFSLYTTFDRAHRADSEYIYIYIYIFVFWTCFHVENKNTEKPANSQSGSTSKEYKNSSLYANFFF